MRRPKLKFVIYKDRMGQFRWRMQTRNNRIIADGGEGYKRWRSLTKTLSRLVGLISSEDYEFVLLKPKGGELHGQEERQEGLQEVRLLTE